MTPRHAAQLIDVTVDIATRHGDHSSVVSTLRQVDVTVTPGKVTALVGESGCGKSLVAAALCGLLPPGARVEGRVLIGGVDFAHADERRWRSMRGRHVGLVPQSAATSFTPVRTLGSQLREICRRLDSDRGVARLLSDAHLPAVAGSLYPHELSGGMAQRAAIAAAIAGRPALLVADEPTSALDPGHAAAVWKLLGAAADSGAGVLVITHELRSLLESNVCHDIALMRSGTVLRQAPVSDLASDSPDYVGAFLAAARR